MEATIPLVRDCINDQLSKCSPDVYEYLSSKVFTLSEPNLSASTLKVYKNGVLWAGTNYTFNADTNKVTVTGTLEVEDVLEFRYSAYKQYSDTELQGFIKSALYYMSIYKFLVDFDVNDDDEIIVVDSSPEEYPTLVSRRIIAIVTSILITGGISSYRTPDITINFTEKETKEEKVRKVVESFRERYGVLGYHSFLVAPDAWYPADENED